MLVRHHEAKTAIEARSAGLGAEERSMTAPAIRIQLLAVLLLAASALPALAETLAFKADLTPVAGTNSKAGGTLAVQYDTNSKKLTWQGSYRGLGTYATAANLHGPDGAIVVRLRSTDSPFEGTTLVPAKQGADLIGGRWYILVRSAAFPDGELRGQIAPAN
jgi:hypothetical protein